LDDIYNYLQISGGDKHKTNQVQSTELSLSILSEDKKFDLKKQIHSLTNEKECRIVLKKLIEEDDDPELEQLKVIYKNSKIEIIDHYKPITIKSVGRMTFFVQRMILWYAYFKNEIQFLELTKKFKVSPFCRSSYGRSTVHMLCLENQPEFLELILLPNYSYFNSKRKFEIKEAISLTSGFGVNTPIHHACLRNHFECFKLLFDMGAPLDVVNYRGWTPLQLAESKDKFKDIKKEIKTKEMVECVSFEPINKLDCSYEKLLKHNSRYHYCIVAVADHIDPEKTTVYKQLEHIQEDWKDKGNLIVDIVHGFDNVTVTNELNKMSFKAYDKMLMKNHYIYKIKLSSELASALADVLNIRVYNQIHKFHTTYIKEERKNYEPLRDLTKQKMLIYLFLREFNIFRFTKKKLILEHFPMHHFLYRKHIDRYWRRYFWATILGSLRVGKRAVGFRALTQIAFYHGLQNGFYFGFLIQLTSYMFPLAMIGLIFYVYGLFIAKEFDNELLPYLSIIIGIWLTLFIEGWTRREKHLAYNFDVLDVSKTEKPRFEYTGNYIVDRVTKKVSKFDQFTPFKRRFFVS
jgi:hypothetical protein